MRKFLTRFKNGSRYVRATVLAAFLSACGVVGPDTEETNAYVSKVLPVVTTWNVEALHPYLTEEAREVFEGDQAKKIFRVFSRLGALKDFNEPETVSWVSSISKGTTLTVKTRAQFENGDGLVTLSLQFTDGALKLQRVNINSPLFLDLADPGNPESTSF